MKVASIPLFPSSSAKIHPIATQEVVTIIDGAISYRGDTLNGKKNGQGTYVDKCAHVEYKGEWHDDNIHGIGVIRNYFTNFSFSGKFENNRMVCGTMTWPNGTVYKGYFDDDNQMNGIGMIKWPNNFKYEGMFENGKLTGPGTFMDNKGNVFEQ
jgi:hypothetical protein